MARQNTHRTAGRQAGSFRQAHDLGSLQIASSGSSYTACLHLKAGIRTVSHAIARQIIQGTSGKRTRHQPIVPAAFVLSGKGFSPTLLEMKVSTCWGPPRTSEISPRMEKSQFAWRNPNLCCALHGFKSPTFAGSLDFHTSHQQTPRACHVKWHFAPQPTAHKE